LGWKRQLTWPGSQAHEAELPAGTEGAKTAAKVLMSFNAGFNTIFNDTTGKFVMWMHVDFDDYADAGTGRNVVVSLRGDLAIPFGKIVLKSPLAEKIESVSGDGRWVPGEPNEIRIEELPATITIRYWGGVGR
jgi:hypothetical protein